VTLNQARVTAQKVFAAKLDGRDLAAEKKASRRRMVGDRVDDLLEAFIAQHVSQNRSGPEISRMLRREIGSAWGNRSIHEITKRDVIDVVSAIEQRGAPVAANKALKAIKTFFRWCVGRAVLDRSPADGVPLPAKEVARDRVLSDDELARIILAARQIGGPYGGIVELLALTGQRREEVARCTWDEIDIGTRTWRLSSARTKNAKAHEVYLSDQALAVLTHVDKKGEFIFSRSGSATFQDFSLAKRELDQLSSVTGWRLHDLRRTCVSGMARLGIPPHLADKILNHQNGTISGVAAVYQRHDFLAERKQALKLWGTHVARIIARAISNRNDLRRVA
jgi:integrase